MHPPQRPWALTIFVCALFCIAAPNHARAQAITPQATAIAPETTQQNTTTRHGTFKDFTGEVKIWRNGAARTANAADALSQGDRIVTGTQSGATVILRDGTVLTVGAASDVTLNQFQFEPTKQEGNVLISMAKGTLRMITGLIGKTQPANVKVQTPTTVVGIRGTDFIVEVQ